MRQSLAYLSIAFLSSSLLVSSGCDFYFGDDDDCDYGDYEGDAPEPYPSEYLRNPESGQCEWFGGGGGYPCDDACGPCYDTAGDREGGAAYSPGWAFCDGYCETLDEVTCWATSGCRGAYIEGATGELSFYQCWGTDQSGPIQGGGCDGLDAYSCSLHDDCIAVHDGDAFCGAGGDGEADQAVPEPCSVIGWFEYCADEPVGCYSDGKCAADERCNAADICLVPPGCADSDGDGLIDCEAACYGFCVPDDVPDPGECWAEVFCDGLEPVCPEGTTPGIKDGCYTGYCIPLSECEDPPPPPPACNTLTTEDACIARDDCSPYYEGIDCTCDAAGNCVCADWVFVSCM
jgi:hypothetical protein